VNTPPAFYYQEIVQRKPPLPPLTFRILLPLLCAASLASAQGLIQTAVTRQTADGRPENGFLPEQRLAVAQAIEAYTLGAASAGRHEKTEGSLEVGKLADLIVVSQNVLDIVPRKIAATKVLTTIVGGKIVYQSETK
jgi:predicted amidohydrolase YtcJ